MKNSKKLSETTNSRTYKINLRNFGRGCNICGPRSGCNAVASKEDRRINLVYLTDIAKPLQQITYELANQTMNEALLDISKEEIDIVKNVFQRVYDNLTHPDLDK